MEQNNFEKQLKEQLQGREIKPSEDAWNRISRQLEITKTPKSKNLLWYGNVAGFIGMIFVSVLYLTMRGRSADTETQLTDVKKDSIQRNSIPEIIQEQNIGDGTFIVKSKVQEEKSIQHISKLSSDTSIKEALVTSKVEEIKIDKVAHPLNTSQELIDTKIAEVVAQVELLEKENSTVTNAEIDSLLRGAQRQILEDKIFRVDKSVDAMALLADVEDELDRSFRDQIFNALKDGFLKVRTAVADRNE